MMVPHSSRRPILSVAASLLLFAAWTAPLAAVEVTKGYFAGSEFRPLLEAKESVLGREPAVVIVFRPEEAAYEQLRQFGAWAAQPHACDAAVYGIAVAGDSQPPVVVEEIVYQIGLKFPVFYTDKDTHLEGATVRVIVLGGGTGTALDSLDPATIEEKLTAACSAAPADDSSPATKPTGKSGSYSNPRYGFSVRFPDGYLYREARSGDGAVATRGDGKAGLDLRVWVESDMSATPDAREYLTLHMTRVEQHLSQGPVEVESRFVVREGLNEGRDYTYTYTSREGKAMRGRVQAIMTDGVIKAASAEGPTADFNNASSTIENFMQSFSAVP